MIYEKQGFVNNDADKPLTAEQLIKMEEAIIDNHKKPFVGSPSIYIPTTRESEVIDSMTAAELYALYDELETSYPKWFIREADLGTNVPLRHYCIRFPDPIFNTESSETIKVNEWTTDCDWDNVLITAGVHGNEKSAAYGAYIFVKELLESWEPWAHFIKSNFIIHLIPLINPNGFDTFTDGTVQQQEGRLNADGVNINRDFESRVSEEAQSVIGLAESLGNKLKVILDVHNCVPRTVWMAGIDPDSYSFKMYRETYAKLAGAFQPLFEEVYGTSYNNYYPCFYMRCSSNSGTMNSWGNSRGYLCNTMEIPRSIHSGSYVNNSESSCLMAALLGNLLQTYGIMNKPK